MKEQIPKAKKPTIRKTPKLLTAMRLMVANVGNLSQAEILRKAGYAESIARNPSKVTKSQLFLQKFEQAGITDDFLSEEFRTLSKLERLEQVVFPARFVLKKGKKTKGKKVSARNRYQYIPCTDEEISAVIGNLSGAKLISIMAENIDHSRTAFVAMPDSAVRKGMIDMGFKVKGHYVADRAFEELTNFMMGKEEEAELDSILGKNKK